jgi:hypothetical protein
MWLNSWLQIVNWPIGRNHKKTTVVSNTTVARDTKGLLIKRIQKYGLELPDALQYLFAFAKPRLHALPW